MDWVGGLGWYEWNPEGVPFSGSRAKQAKGYFEIHTPAAVPLSVYCV
jgi:hypothetical protein